MHRLPAIRRSTTQRGAPLLFAAIAFVVGSCSGGDSNDVAPEARATAVTAFGSTPTSVGTPASAAPPAINAGQTTTVAAPDAPAPTFESSIISTPEALLTDVLPPGATVTPSEFSIIGTAVVPRVEVYRTAQSTAPFTTLSNPLPDGKTPLTLLVDAQSVDRAKVLLPIQPNGSTGWVKLQQISTARNDFRIEVSLRAFEMKVFRGADEILNEKVGIGTEVNPTPVGRFYIKALLRPPNQDTVYGHYAYPLSGTSEAMTEWNGGEPTLGIHGTNDATASIGKRVSHGCIRMTNEAITQLAKILPLGTPVIVTP